MLCTQTAAARNEKFSRVHQIRCFQHFYAHAILQIAWNVSNLHSLIIVISWIFFNFIPLSTLLLELSRKKKRARFAHRTCARYDELKAQKVTVILLLLSIVVVDDFSSNFAAQHKCAHARDATRSIAWAWRKTIESLAIFAFSLLFFSSCAQKKAKYESVSSALICEQILK